jgi:hypothetical protein
MAKTSRAAGLQIVPWTAETRLSFCERYSIQVGINWPSKMRSWWRSGLGFSMSLSDLTRLDVWPETGNRSDLRQSLAAT